MISTIKGLGQQEPNEPATWYLAADERFCAFTNDDNHMVSSKD